MSKSSVKKGSIINRAANHTVNQDVAASSPKWQDVGGGILQSRTGTHINQIHRNGDTNKWESVKKSPIVSQEA